MRVWEVRFEVYQAMSSFPEPGVLVEEVQKDPSYSFSGLNRLEKGGQLVFTLEGIGGFSANGKEYRLPPGKAFLANHNDPKHSYFYPPECKEPWRFLWISMHGANSEEMIYEINKRHGYVFSLPRNKGIIKRLEGYKNYRNTVQALAPLAGAKLVMDVLTSLGSSIEKEFASDPQNNLIRKAQQLIFENMEKNTGINELAEALNVSREHLSRVFKRQTGVSPAEYIMKKKMKFAVYLLRDSSLSCKEIAERVGYDNSTSFTRAFKRLMHITPNDFRTIGYIPEELISEDNKK